jgi:hypothetical protein
VDDSSTPGPDVGAAPARNWRRIALSVLAVLLAAGLLALFAFIEFGGGKDKKGTTGPPTVPVDTLPPASATPAPAESAGPSLDPDGNPLPTATPSRSEPAESGSDAGQQGVPAGWRETAEGFGRAFTDTRGGQQAWFNRLAPFLTPEKAEQYKRVPVEAVPKGALVSVDMRTPTGVAGDARLAYDSGLVIEITVAHNGLKWQVASIIDRPRTGG